MAGSEAHGIEAADAGLLRGRPYIVTPTGFTDKQAVHRLAEVVRAIGMRPVVMQPEVHDRLVALISHLPYLVACSLVLTAASEPESLEVAGPTFGEVARVARSPSGLWTQILRMNRAEVERALEAFRDTLARLERALAEDGIEAVLAEAREVGIRVEGRKS